MTLGNEDCPRCGCWMTVEFNCDCGQIHASVCLNCGRYTAPSLRRDEYAEPDEIVPPCTTGPVAHEHHHDYGALIAAYMAKNS